MRIKWKDLQPNRKEEWPLDWVPKFESCRGRGQKENNEVGSKFSSAEVKLSEAKKNIATLTSQMETMTKSLVNVKSREAQVHQDIYNKLQMEVVKVISNTKAKYFKEGWNVGVNAARVPPNSNLFL